MWLGLLSAVLLSGHPPDYIAILNTKEDTAMKLPTMTKPIARSYTARPATSRVRASQIKCYPSPNCEKYGCFGGGYCFLGSCCYII